MPEMPEVETIARQLRRTILGKQVSEIRLSGLPLRKPVEESFAGKLRGRTIRKVLRRGKYLVLEMEPKAFWLIHLGMSGRILHREAGGAASRHTHAIFRFSDETGLEYRDPRRFGLLAAYEGIGIDQIPEIRFLGRDPLNPGFNARWLEGQLRRSRRDVKSFLLDQSRVAGLGNIYVCESLFLARIHPARRCLTLNGAETARLVASVREVLKNAIRRRGTSFSDFIGSDGKRGSHQRYLAVFQRQGEPCGRCGKPVQRLCQGNRSTFFCGNCQT